MKRTTLALLLGLPLALNAANYYLVKGTEVDMSNVKNYRIGSIDGETVTAMPTDEDYLYVNGTNAVLNTTGVTIKPSHFVFNNSTIDIKGSGNSLIDSNANRTGNLYFGSKDSTTTLNVLGSGNTYTLDIKGMSLNYSDISSSSGVNKIYVSSSSTEESGRNKFNLNPNGGNIFIHNSNVTGSTMKSIIEIGDNTDFHAGNQINLGDTNSVAGETKLLFSGKNSKFTSNGNIVINAASGTAKSSVEFAGENNYFYYGLSFQIGWSAAMSGDAYAALEVRGKDNELSLNNIFIGNANSTGGVAKLVFEGSTNKITVRGYTVFYLKGDVDEVTGKKIGGGIDFIADKDGFATVTINNFSNKFDGLLTIDFSNYVVKDSDKGDIITLATISQNANNLLHMFDIGLNQLNDASYVNVKGSDDYQWVLTNNSLGVKVFSTIPEPSTYVAIFGAVALAFVAYRRRK